ncbi:MAG: secretin N-terminal domain-containing protein [Candidatus Omnitrophota bacterium]
MKAKSKIFLLLFLFLSVAFNLSARAADTNDPQAELDAQTQPGKISLDIKNMDIIDVLKVLAMRGNLNIVAGRNVAGKVTLFLKNVDVMDALEIVLAANNLTYEKKGSIINVITEKDYEMLYGETSTDKKAVSIMHLQYAKAIEVGKALNLLRSKVGRVIINEGSNTVVLLDVPQRLKDMEEAIRNMDLPTETKTFVLNYAKVKDLETSLKESLTKNVGEIKIDERMNKIIITDLPEKVDYLGNIISAFDEKDKVVLIEAKIIQITLNKNIGYGVNWNSVFAGIDSIAAADLSVNLPAGINSWPTTFTYTRAHGATVYGDQIILKLLETLGKTNVLSTPRITVANNQEAKVLVGTKEAFVTSTVTQSGDVTTTADAVQFVDVGVALSVTPVINADNYVNMKIKPVVSSAPTKLELTNPDGSVRTSVPIVTTSEAETKLLVKDGTTIILAGLMKDTRKDNLEKIPFLCDIPLIGELFKSKGKEGEKTELVIFLTPHIIRDDENVIDEARSYVHEHEETGLKTHEGSAAKFNFNSDTEKDASLVLDAFSRSSDFQQYCNYITERINNTLRKYSPEGAGQERQQIQLSFILASDGSLRERPRVLTPVSRELKELIVRSVEEATPFSPFPDSSAESEKTFNLTIYFEGH